jgi:hypothetical protein
MSTTTTGMMISLFFLTLFGIQWAAAQSNLPGSGWNTGQQIQK